MADVYSMAEVDPEMGYGEAEVTRTARSDANQIKVLSLETCEEGLAGYQLWGVRTSAK